MPDAKIAQQDFSGGEYTGRRDLIPPNGFSRSVNGLIDPLGSVYKRGGTTYLTSAFGTTGLRFIWNGWLANGGQTTIVGTEGKWGKVSGGSVTNLSGTGITTPGRPAVYKGIIYLPGGDTYDGTTKATAKLVAPFYTMAGSRMWAGEADTVRFSKLGKPEEAWETATDYHKLPGGTQIIGLEGVRDSVAVFTTHGLWLIRGGAHDLTDAAGNVQQSLDLYSADFTLWGNGGIAAWEGALVVPGADGVYLMSVGTTSERRAFQRISDPIADRYQQYVRSGYQPGQATVYKGHYFLPVLGPSSVVDLLVCRLDLPSHPWTRLEGEGSRVAALTTKFGSGAARTPELLGALYPAAEPRPITCAWLEPSGNAELEHTGNPINFALITRAFTTGSLVPNFIRRVRLRYEMAGPAPAIQGRILSETEAPGQGGARWGSGVRWGGFKWGSKDAIADEAMEGVALADQGGSTPHTWRPQRKRRFVTFRFIQNAATSKLIVRSIEIFVRQTGRP